MLPKSTVVFQATGVAHSAGNTAQRYLENKFCEAALYCLTAIVYFCNWFVFTEDHKKKWRKLGKTVRSKYYIAKPCFEIFELGFCKVTLASKCSNYGFFCHRVNFCTGSIKRLTISGMTRASSVHIWCGDSVHQVSFCLLRLGNWS